MYIGTNRSTISLLEASAEFPHCPILTHLTIQSRNIDISVPRTLRSAIQSEKLPSLRRVTIVECYGQGPRSDWPEEVEVTITDDENEAKLLKMFKSDEIESSNSNC